MATNCAAEAGEGAGAAFLWTGEVSPDSGWRLKDTLPFPWRIIERPKDRGGRYPSLGSDSCGISVPIGSLNRLLLWGMFLATLPHSLLRYGCEIFATLRVFLNRSQIQDRFSAEVLSKQ